MALPRQINVDKPVTSDRGTSGAFTPQGATGGKPVVRIPPPLPSTTAYLIEMEQEQDGRWIAEIPELPGALVYGDTPQEAMRNVVALAYRVLADKVEHDEVSVDQVTHITFQVPM